MRRVIHGEIYSDDFNRLNKLVRDWSSCYRFCFCRFQKDKLKFNDVRNKAKAKYPSLNTRQISDAALQAQSLFNRVKKKKVIFGTRGNWNKLIKKELSKQQWQDKRDNQIYSRGDIAKKGNPNTRLLNKNGALFIRVTLGTRIFEEYRLFIPSKFKERTLSLFASKEPYNVRLLRKDAHRYRAIVDYEVRDPESKIGFSNGSIGVDVNPDRVAISEITPDGNLIKSLHLLNNRIFFASTCKRNYQIGCIVKQLITYALNHKKAIAFENLKFKKDFENQGRKFNRIKSTFVWKKLLTLLEHKCIEHGLGYKNVNPAFTSTIGKLKYQNMYNLSIHQAASYVIARRGLGFNERLSLYKYPSRPLKESVLDLVGDRTRRIHSWALWRALRDNYKAVLTGPRSRMSGLKEPDGPALDDICDVKGNLRCKGENPLGKAISPELVRRCLND